MRQLQNRVKFKLQLPLDHTRFLDLSTDGGLSVIYYQLLTKIKRKVVMVTCSLHTVSGTILSRHNRLLFWTLCGWLWTNSVQQLAQNDPDLATAPAWGLPWKLSGCDRDRWQQRHNFQNTCYHFSSPIPWVKTQQQLSRILCKLEVSGETASCGQFDCLLWQIKSKYCSAPTMQHSPVSDSCVIFSHFNDSYHYLRQGVAIMFLPAIIYLFVKRIIQKITFEFWWNFQEKWEMTKVTIDYILAETQITIWMQDFFFLKDSSPFWDKTKFNILACKSQKCSALSECFVIVILIPFCLQWMWMDVIKEHIAQITLFIYRKHIIEWFS